MALPATLLIHAPLKDTTMAEQLLRSLTDNIHWSHFGDLSPESLQLPICLLREYSGQRCSYLKIGRTIYDYWVNSLRYMEREMVISGSDDASNKSTQFLFENQQTTTAGHGLRKKLDPPDIVLQQRWSLVFSVV